MPFLTDLDSRAAIKGSRDPLGLVPIWSRVGRSVVGNLTTVSSSVRGFTTLLLGYHFAEQVQERYGNEGSSPLDTFLKFEQLAAYARWHVGHDNEFRGIERVADRLVDGPRASLGTGSSQQILSNQKVYGLWGLFSMPARASGILEQNEPVLTPRAREFVESRYVNQLTAAGFRDGREIVDLLRRAASDVYLEGRHAPLVRAIAALFSKKYSAAERTFYDHHLSEGGDDDPTDGCQRVLAHLLAQLPSNHFGMKELLATARLASKHPGGEVLASHLDEIRKLEQLIVPMDNAFGFLLSRQRQPLADVAKEMGEAWGRSLRHVDVGAIEALRPKINAAFREEGTTADCFVDIATAFANGQYDEAVKRLIEHNAFVMESRNGSQPWIRIEGRRLDIRYQDESRILIPGDQLRDQWVSTYFINSLATVVTTLKAG